MAGRYTANITVFWDCTIVIVSESVLVKRAIQICTVFDKIVVELEGKILLGSI